jgi:protease I
MKTIAGCIACLLALTAPNAAELDGVNVAVMIAEGFHDEETTYPMERLSEAGAAVTVIGPETGEKEAYNSNQRVSVEKRIDEVAVEDFHGLIIPGGHSPERLVEHAEAVNFARAFFETGRMTAAICHGPLVLVAADVVDGYEATGWGSISDELEDAGAEYVNQEVVIDRSMITSRQPDDLPAFVEAITNALAAQHIVTIIPRARPNPATSAGAVTASARPLIAVNGRAIGSPRANTPLAAGLYLVFGQGGQHTIVVTSPAMP